MSPSVLLDLSNLRSGGGKQVGASVLDELATLSSEDLSRWPWLHNIVIEGNGDLVADAVEDLTDVDLRIVERSPIRRLLRPRLGVRYDASFTVFGPDYSWRRASRRIVGFADVTSLRPEFIDPSPRFASNVRRTIRRLVSRALFRRAERIVVEAPSVAADLTDRWGIPRERISVVPNVVNEAVLARRDEVVLPSLSGTTLVYPTRAYPHKNIGILGAVGQIVKRRYQQDVTFILTLEDHEWDTLDDLTKRYSYNLGPVRVSQLASLYAQVNGTIFVSLNECFSVTPLEALAVGSPLVASDRAFVADVAGEAALYCEPTSADSIADAIGSFVLDTSAREQRVAMGLERAKAWPSARDRAAAYLQIISQELGGA